MRKLIQILSAGALALAMSTPVGASTPLCGVWVMDDGKTKLAFEDCGEAVCGRIVAQPKIEANPDLTDSRNHDPALRQRKLKGLQVLTVQSTGAAEWSGQAYNPDDGGTYRAMIHVVDGDTLKVTGCMLKVLCQSVVLTRAPESYASRARSKIAS